MRLYKPFRHAVGGQRSSGRRGGRFYNNCATVFSRILSERKTCFDISQIRACLAAGRSTRIHIGRSNRANMGVESRLYGSQHTGNIVIVIRPTHTG